MTDDLATDDLPIEAPEPESFEADPPGDLPEVAEDPVNEEAEIGTPDY